MKPQRGESRKVESEGTEDEEAGREDGKNEGVVSEGDMRKE
jgi:hypothetical protein